MVGCIEGQTAGSLSALIITVALVFGSPVRQTRTMRSGVHPHPYSEPSSAFAGYRFPPEVITLAVRWLLRFGLSYRDVEELLAERGSRSTTSPCTDGFSGSHLSSPRPRGPVGTWSGTDGKWTRPT